MPGTRRNIKLLQETLAIIREHGSTMAAARATGIPRSTLQHRYNAAIAWEEGERKTKNSLEITCMSAEHVRTLADLIRVCEIDIAEWDVERWVCNKWEVASKGPEPEVEPIVTPLYQVKAWLKRKSVIVRTLDELRAGLLSDIRAEAAADKSLRATRRYVSSGWLFEFAPFDLHMGKYTWDEETITNYDVDIAADLFDAALEFLLSRALKLTDGRLERILCIFGNDVSHVDTKRGETTEGTHMDVDTRYIKVYRRICAVHRRALDTLRQVAPVDVQIVAGNHDELTSFHLGEVLAARYGDDKHIVINNSPRMRKYYDFGINLFGFTHGNTEKVSELPLLMAREVPDRWARCTSREWHIGHKHVAEKFEARGRLEQDFFSDKGVRVRRLTSLTAHDAWHVKHGYIDRRACDSFVFHKEAGFTDHLSFNCDHFTGAPMMPKSKSCKST